MRGRAGKDLVESTSRTNTAAWLDFKQDKTVERLEEILAEVTGTDPEFGENLQILHYEPTQEFKEHHDYFDPATDPPENFVPGGNRLATAIVYLDVAAQGGETLFTRIDKRVKPQPGDALLFYDLTPEGTVDIQTMHAGQQPIGGEKWCAAAPGRASRAPLTNLPRPAAAAGRCDPRDVCAWGPSVGWAAALDALQNLCWAGWRPSGSTRRGTRARRSRTGESGRRTSRRCIPQSQRPTWCPLPSRPET
jgi:hypothetical protein